MFINVNAAAQELLLTCSGKGIFLGTPQQPAGNLGVHWVASPLTTCFLVERNPKSSELRPLSGETMHGGSQLLL